MIIIFRFQQKALRAAAPCLFTRKEETKIARGMESKGPFYGFGDEEAVVRYDAVHKESVEGREEKAKSLCPALRMTLGNEYRDG